MGASVASGSGRKRHPHRPLERDTGKRRHNSKFAAAMLMHVADLPATPRKRSPTHVQRAVLLALIIRELRARVQGRWLSLLWMVFEPLAHVLIILALFGFRKHAVSVNTEFPVFLVTGMLPYFMFRNLERRLPNAITSNRGLYAYRQVKPLDPLIARAVVEIGLSSAVYVSALCLLGWIGFHWLPIAPLELMGVSVVLLVLGLSLGLIFAIAAHGRPKVESMIGMLFLPMYLLSGVIFPVHNFPVELREWLLWNPVLHLIDLSRQYFIPNFQPLPGASLAYPAAFALATSALAASLYRLHRHNLVTAGQ
jgi:capsular polysaccharide transport system permease protein